MSFEVGLFGRSQVIRSSGQNAYDDINDFSNFSIPWAHSYLFIYVYFEQYPKSNLF